MAGSSYNPDHAGMAEFLNSHMLLDLVSDVANRIKDRAIALSPVDTGEYISSFKVRSHRFGGVHNDRAEAIMYNDARDAFWVEFGQPGREPYHVIRRAAFEVHVLWLP